MKPLLIIALTLLGMVGAAQDDNPLWTLGHKLKQRHQQSKYKFKEQQFWALLPINQGFFSELKITNNCDVERVGEVRLYRRVGDQFLREFVDLKPGEKWEKRLEGALGENFDVLWGVYEKHKSVGENSCDLTVLATMNVIEGNSITSAPQIVSRLSEEIAPQKIYHVDYSEEAATVVVVNVLPTMGVLDVCNDPLSYWPGFCMDRSAIPIPGWNMRTFALSPNRARVFYGVDSYGLVIEAVRNIPGDTKSFKVNSGIVFGEPGSPN